MTVHAYPLAALRGDYLRAAAGLLPCLAILALVPLVPLATAAVGGFAALFAGFAIRTALRQWTRIEMTETALLASGLRGATIPWTALDGMKLAYYSTRRESGDGWMQLVLRAGRARLSVDSRIDGFPRLVARAARAAAARRLPLNRATLANLEALGITPAEVPSFAVPATGEPL
ncbi:MAG TPA: hypothetical protein VJ770_23390 [Stellaceae bacterium]|nr:hypothetical protein [Stellaceae bacterium]